MTSRFILSHKKIQNNSKYLKKMFFKMLDNKQWSLMFQKKRHKWGESLQLGQLKVQESIEATISGMVTHQKILAVPLNRDRKKTTT